MPDKAKEESKVQVAAGEGGSCPTRAVTSTIREWLCRSDIVIQQKSRDSTCSAQGGAKKAWMLGERSYFQVFLRHLGDYQKYSQGK